MGMLCKRLRTFDTIKYEVSFEGCNVWFVTFSRRLLLRYVFSWVRNFEKFYNSRTHMILHGQFEVRLLLYTVWACV